MVVRVVVGVVVGAEPGVVAELAVVAGVARAKRRVYRVLLAGIQKKCEKRDF